MNNTCKLKLFIPLDKINEIYDLLKKPYEVAGYLICDDNNNVTGVKINKGDSQSVSTPNNVINFHTHPVSAYNNGKTVWGWPSGEDIRESIKFALAGNKAHIVFTVEGIYTIQVSPCKIEKIKELLDSSERGVLIFLIEEYFKTTHNFRGVQEVNDLAKTNRFINPYSYVDFANTFDLSNLTSAKTIYHKDPIVKKLNEIGHTGIHSEGAKFSGVDNEETVFSKIPNLGFPNMEKDYIVNSPLKNYIVKQDLNDMRSIGKDGRDNLTNPVKNVDAVLKKLDVLLKKFETSKCTEDWNSHRNAWFFVNFFPSKNYLSEKHLSGKKFVSPDKNDNNYIPLEPFIRIFSNSKNGCSVNKIAKTNKFDITFNGATSSSFGVQDLTNSQRCLLYSIIFTVKSKRELLARVKVKYKDITMNKIDNELDFLKKKFNVPQLQID